MRSIVLIFAQIPSLFIIKLSILLPIWERLEQLLPQKTALINLFAGGTRIEY